MAPRILEEGLDSLACFFFSLITDLARSYIDTFGVDGGMDLGVGLKETGERGDDEGVERINGGSEGSVGGIKGGGWVIRIGGGDDGDGKNEIGDV
jgi:hypothetical protein